ncbi:MAG: substrate-binding domain-containing protein, partial [Polyangia bacterium]
MSMTAAPLVRPPRLPVRGACASLFLTVIVGTISRPGRAQALECTDLPGPVYVTGSTAAKPILVEVAKILVAQTPPVTVVYSGQGSSAGVDAVLNGKPLYGSASTPLSYWDMTGTEAKCTVSATTKGVIADVGMSDVFANTCFASPGGLPSNVEDFLGPIQTMTFVVPKSSPERSISAEAAYYVFGFGSASGAAPWTDQTAALVPPSRRHVTRYFGVLSSHSKLRPNIVPSPPGTAPAAEPHTEANPDRAGR